VGTSKRAVLVILVCGVLSIGIVPAFGFVAWDKPTYRIGDSAMITVNSLDENKNPVLIDIFTIVIKSDSYPMGISVTVVESGVNTGLFSGGITFTSDRYSRSDLYVKEGDQVYASHGYIGDAARIESSTIAARMESTTTVSKTPISTPEVVSTSSVKIPRGTSVPGCEETFSCYSPYSIAINAGTTVTWTNKDSKAHTVTSGSAVEGPDGNFDSGVIRSGRTFSHTFENSGVYEYFDITHPWQTGVVFVGKLTSDGRLELSPPLHGDPEPSQDDWQEKYFAVQEKFNEASAKVGQLQEENSELKNQISELTQTIEKLNALVMEQVMVIYEWVVGR